MERILAQSDKYIISHEYEVVFLRVIEEDREIVIGDFYGDPETAFISSDERYCVVGGCGLIVYYLKEPFIEFEYHKTTNQWIEFFRGRDDFWWVSNIEKGSSTEWIKFEINRDDDQYRAGTYQLNVYTSEVKKLN